MEVPCLFQGAPAAVCRVCFIHYNRVQNKLQTGHSRNNPKKGHLQHFLPQGRHTKGRFYHVCKSSHIGQNFMQIRFSGIDTVKKIEKKV